MSARPPRSRRSRRIVITGAVALVVLVLLLLGFFPQDLLRGVVERRLRSSLGPGSSVGRLHVTPGRLSARIEDLVIVGSTYRLEVPLAVVTVRPGFLVGHQLEFSSVDLQGARLLVTVPDHPTPDSPPLTRPIVVGSLTAKDATLTYRSEALGGDVVLRGLTFAGGIGEGEMRVTGRGDWLRNPPVAAEKLDAKLEVSSLLDVKVKDLDATLAHSHLHADGTLGPLGALRPDLRFDGTLELRDLSVLPGAPAATGTVKANGSFTRDATGNRLTVELTGDGLDVAGWPLDLRRAHVLLAPSQPARVELSARALGGSVEGNGTFADGVADAKLRVTGIDAEALARHAGRPLPLSGRVSGDLSAHGDPKGTLRVETQLRALGDYAGAPPFEASAHAAGTFRPSTRAVDLGFTASVDTRGPAHAGSLTVRAAHVTAAGRAQGAMPPAVQASIAGTLEVEAQGRTERIPVKGTVRSGADRWALDLTGDALGGSVHAAWDARGAQQHLRADAHGLDIAALLADATGRADVTYEGRGTAPWRTGNGDARLSGVQWRGAQLGDVTASLRGGLTSGAVQFAAPALAATGSGRLGGNAFTGRLTLAGTSLATLQPAVAPDRPLSGTVAGSFDVRVPFADPQRAEMHGVVDALDVTTDRFSARAVRPFRLSARDGRFTLDQLEATGPGLQVAGSLGFGTRPADQLSGRLALQVDLSRLPVAAGWTLGGTASGDVTLSGTGAHPRATGLLAVKDGSFQAPGKPMVTAGSGAIALEGETMSTAGITVSTKGGQAVIAGRLPLAALVPPATVQRLGMDASLPLDLRITGDIDLASVPAPQGWTLAGTGKGEVMVTGTIARPRLTGLLAVRNASLQSPGAPLVSLQDGEVRLEGDVITVSGMTLTANGATLEVTGNLPLAAVLPESAATRLAVDRDHPLDLHVRGDVDLAGLQGAGAWTGTGRAHLDAAVVGTVADPSATGSLELTNVVLSTAGAPVVSIATGSVDLRGDVVSTTGLTGSVAGGTVTVTGEVPLGAVLRSSGSRLGRLASTRGAGDVSVRWSDVAIGRLLEVLQPDQPSRVEGALTGEAHVTGMLSDPRGLDGSVTLQGTTLQFQQAAVQLEPATLEVKGGVVRTDGIVLSTGNGRFALSGDVDLGARTLAVTGKGGLDLDAFSPFLPDASLSGRSEVDLRVDGPLSAPLAHGSLTVSDGTLRLREIREALTDVSGAVVFSGDALRIDGMTGRLGGGEVDLAGSARVAGLAVSDVKVTMTGQDLTLRYPIGGRQRASDRLGDVKTRSDVELTLTGEPGDMLLAGTVRVQHALYDVDIFVGDGLLAPAIPPQALTPSSLQTSIALNLSVELVNPAVIRNNLAEMQVTGSFWVRGDMATPAPFGRVGLEPGGKVFLQGREFTVTSGSLTYGGTLDPQVAVQAATTIKQTEQDDIDVRINAGGTLDYPTLSLSSDPPRSEKELASLVATGRSDVALSSGAWIVGEQAAALLAGKFTREVTRGLLDLGFDQVELQPELLARESNPGARFTFGKQVSDQLRFIYSVGLNSAEAQYYAAQFRFKRGREFTAKVQRFDTGHTTYGVGQRLRFGGPKRAAQTVAEDPKVTLSEVRLVGERPLADAQVLKGVRAKKGRKMARFDLLDDADKIRQTLVRQGHLEAEVASSLDGTAAVFTIRAGPLHGWRVDGLDNPPDLDPVVYGASYEEEAMDKGRDTLLDDLHRRGFLRAVVQTSEIEQGGNEVLVFTVRPGPLLKTAEVTFPGATQLTQADLLAAAGGPSALLVNARQAVESIKAAYRTHQYLAAQVELPRVAETPNGVRVVVPVQEGPRAVIAAVQFPGATVPAEELLARVKVAPGDAYDQLAATAAVQRIRDLYLTRGYAAVRVVPEVVPAGTDLDLVFHVTEGDRVLIGPVTITGLKRTRLSIVRRQIHLHAGDALDPRELANVERRLLDLGAFSRAVVTAEPGNPAAIKVELEESAPFRAAYDLRYDTVDRGSALVDGEVGNLFGLGLTVGGRFRLGTRVRETRGSIHSPAVGGFGDLTATAFRLDERLLSLREEVLPDPLPGRTDRRYQQGMTLQQAGHFAHPWELLYGYRWQRDYDTSALPITEDVGAVSFAAALDTRGDPLDPRRGQFLSFSLEGGQKALGSDIDFLKWFAQLLLTRPVGPSLTWAQGYRVGLAGGLGDPRLSVFRIRGGSGARAERFRAGGPNTLRGFSVDGLGARDMYGDPLGGQAVLVLNQELRFRTERGYGAAVFYDVGNVFPSVKDFGKDLRHSVGVGLRYDSPLGLVRVDVGFPIARRPGEAAYQIHFGFGQAF